MRVNKPNNSGAFARFLVPNFQFVNDKF